MEDPKPKVKFKESMIVHEYLDGLTGVEIGGSAHNPFGLDTINIDRHGSMETVFKNAEEKLCGEKLRVDIVAEGDALPLKDKSCDFVVSSHVIEHIFDPILALHEWMRVARRYVVMIVPHKERTFDKESPLTSLDELKDRHEGVVPKDRSDRHHSVWDTETFLKLCAFLHLDVVECVDTDDKVGNGFLVVIEVH